jgi:hypothetical protein
MPPRLLTRNWIWFFLLLALLGILAVAIPLVVNLQQQLTSEQLQAARALWAAHAPRNYDLEVESKEEGIPPAGGERQQSWQVRVRNGTVEAVVANGTDVSPPFPPYDVPGLFDRIEELLQQNQKTGGAPSFLSAQFDREDGHPLHVVQRIQGTRQRLEIIVRMRKLSSPLAPP